jgi:transposase
MPGKTMDVREQRVSFVVTARRGEKSFSALCEEFGISRPTGYLWLSRYEQDGLSGITERSRRPRQSGADVNVPRHFVKDVLGLDTKPG